ncbi:MAG: DUF885 domain-containing protein [Myxococcales bacterium]|nr:DUF885 domain-containing protein [Myxococcales bacterium]
MAEPRQSSLGVDDPALRALLDEAWSAQLQRHPVWASRIGDRTHAHRLPDLSHDAHLQALDEAEDRIARAEQLDLSEPTDELTRELLVHGLEGFVREGRTCRSWTWVVGAQDNPVSRTAELPKLHDLGTDDGREAFHARLEQLPAWVDEQVSNLTIGLRTGRVADAESLARVVDLVDRELARPRDERPLAATPHAQQLLAERIDPALQRYRDLLAHQLAPAAPPPGLTHAPDGAACYAARIRQHTGSDLDPDDVHRTGLQELRRIAEEIAPLGEELFGLSRVTEIGAHLRSSPELHFATADEIRATATATLQRAQSAVPSVFARLPTAPCEVRPIPAHIAPFTYIAYYQPVDASGVGAYCVNTHAPTTRPRWDAEALAFHESVPGHHLQLALARELSIPAFRRHRYETAYCEGWALYAERLADELQLYSGALDRLGMHSFDAWRAARLVVDTGIHHRGWSRERAVAFLADHTLLAPNNVDNEVNRYIGWPGQALAYKLGQLEVLALRDEARSARGARFDLAAFHTAVLEAGPLPLPILRRRVQRWLHSAA